MNWWPEKVQTITAFRKRLFQIIVPMRRAFVDSHLAHYSRAHCSLLFIGTWSDPATQIVHGRSLKREPHRKLLYPTCFDQAISSGAIPSSRYRGERVPREKFLFGKNQRSMTCEVCIERLEAVIEQHATQIT